MNILILSSGSRVKLVEYFKEEFNRKGFKVYTADCSELAPTLYISDGYFIVPRITEPFYLEKIIDICKKNNIGAIISLIDPELTLISENKDLLEQNGIVPIVSDIESIITCFNKFEMFSFLKENNIDTPLTFDNELDLKQSLKQNELDFPLFAKPVCGSASVDTILINSYEELEKFDFTKDYIVQEFIAGKEYGVDVYIDMISGEIIDIFIKEKIHMRAGETDKSISIESEKISHLVEKLLTKLCLKGPIDIDIFELDGKLMISEVNPRFGGGYLHAYENGHDFIRLIENNINNKLNNRSNVKFKKTIMMKYSSYVVKNITSEEKNEEKYLDF